MDDMKDMKEAMKNQAESTQKSAMDRLAEATAKAEAASKAMRAKQTTTKADTDSAAPATYTVVSGDSLWKIADKVLGDGNKWKLLYEANKEVIGDNPDRIRAGQELTIPNLES